MTFADNNLKVTQMMDLALMGLKTVLENTAGNGDNALYQHFSFFSQQPSPIAQSATLRT